MAIDCVSNYLRDALNDHLHGGPAFTRPATTYFALFTSSPSSSGGGTEVTGGSYARVAVTNDSTHWPASSGQTKLNASVIDWGTATANWGILLAVGEFDAATAGNLLNFMLLRTSVTVNSGQAFSIPINGAVYNWDPACCYSNYLRDKMGDHIHGGPAFTRPATTYFALMSVKATPAGGGTEFVIGTGSYARVVVTNNSTNWPASSSQTKGDGVLLDWGTATANWGTAIQICEYDAATGGNLLTMGDLVTPYVINSGTPFQIPVNGAVFNWA